MKDDQAQTYLSRGLVRSELGNITGVIADIKRAKVLFLAEEDQEGYQQAEQFLQQIQK